MLFNLTVDSIINEFTKTIDKLHTLANQRHEDADSHDAKAVDFTQKAVAARTERDRAIKVADKMREIFSV